MLTFRKTNILTVVALGVLFLCELFITIPALVYVICVFSWLIVTVIGSFNITWNYHLKAYNRNTNIEEKRIAITFDDGPNNKFTPKILELLKAFNAKATFFCIGKQIKQHPDILKRIVNEGHTIGNHSYSHSTNFDFYKKHKVIDELNKTNDLVEMIIGKKLKLFRPPYGVTNPSIAKAIEHTKHYVIGWNIRSLDTVIKSEEKILNRITENISPGSIILLHDSQEITVSVLEQLLLFLQKNDYQTTTIEALFNIEAYA